MCQPRWLRYRGGKERSPRARASALAMNSLRMLRIRWTNDTRVTYEHQLLTPSPPRGSTHLHHTDNIFSQFITFWFLVQLCMWMFNPGVAFCVQYMHIYLNWRVICLCYVDELSDEVIGKLDVPIVFSKTSKHTHTYTHHATVLGTTPAMILEAEKSVSNSQWWINVVPWPGIYILRRQLSKKNHAI